MRRVILLVFGKPCNLISRRSGLQMGTSPPGSYHEWTQTNPLGRNRSRSHTVLGVRSQCGRFESPRRDLEHGTGADGPLSKRCVEVT